MALLISSSDVMKSTVSSLQSGEIDSPSLKDPAHVYLITETDPASEALLINLRI
jgi:hypothetical protein